MHSKLVLTALLGSSVLAAPGSLCKKGACNADNCLRAVRATGRNVVPQASQAAADCRSFFQSTVTAAVPTTTSITTVTITQCQGATAPTATGREIRARASSAAGGLPPYIATACSNAARYSSACSCAGITSYGTMTQAPSSTATATSTLTVTVATACSSTITASPSSLTTTTTTSPISPTTTTTSISSTSSSSSTISSSSTTSPSSTTTTSQPTPTPSTCNTFVVRSNTNGAGQGKYAAFDSQVFLSTNDLSSATKWTLLSNGQVAQSSNPTQVWASYAGSGATILIADAASLPPRSETGSLSFDVHALFCSIDSANNGALSCQGWAGFGYTQEVFQLCPDSEGSAVVVDATVDTAFDGSCTGISLSAVPACD